jgi:hypothetical protein
MASDLNHRLIVTYKLHQNSGGVRPHNAFPDAVAEAHAH